jgi:hypothetical protein
VAENAKGIDGCRIAGTAPVFAQVTEEDDENFGQDSHGPGKVGSQCWVVTSAAFTLTAGTAS